MSSLRTIRDMSIFDKDQKYTRNEKNESWDSFSYNEIKDGTRMMWANTGITNYVTGRNFASPVEYTLAHLELAKKRSKNKRKALVVGIDTYTRIQGANLSGCVNDAKDFANTLLILGFPPTRIKILTNEKATKANIIKGLEWLVKDAKPGDVLVYYHSGHGSQKTDLDGDEEDRYDEMLITSDFYWVDQSTHLTDDDLHNYFTGKLPEGVTCDVIFDTCFSGTGTRSLLHQAVPFTASNQVYSPDRIPPMRTARFLPPPVEQRMRLNTMIPAETQVNHLGDRFIQKKQHNTMHSACAENQVAWEMANEHGQVRGVYTYELCQILRRCNGNKTRRNIYQILRNAMAEKGYEQIPQLEVANNEAYDLYPFRRKFEDDASEIQEE